jgi:hypothetical protein
MTADEIKVGFLHFPPFYIYNSQGNPEHSGTIINLIQNILDQAGYQYSFTNYPPARLYNNLASGRYNIAWAQIQAKTETLDAEQ